MGLLDSVIGVLSGVRSMSGRGDMLNAVLRLLADDGDGPGFDAVMERFRGAGFSHVMDSWIAWGRNLSISPDDLQHVLGTESVDDMAEQLGLSRHDTAERLAQMLPYVVDKLTPQGGVPDDGLGDMGQLMGRLAGR